MHKFRHRSTRLCVGTHVCQIQWNNAMWRPLRCLRTFKVIDFSTNQKLIYDLLLVCLLILTYLLSCNISKSWLIIAQITLLLGWFPANIAINDISPKTRFFGLHFRYRKYRCTLTVWDIIPKLLSCMLLYLEAKALPLPLLLPSGWTTSSAEAVHQLRPNAQPRT